MEINNKIMAHRRYARIIIVLISCELMTIIKEDAQLPL
jgi:hypothetical protein